MCVTFIAFLFSLTTTTANTYNVVDYGATPSAPGDDTAGIQAALDAALAHAGTDTVYVPAGVYYVDGIFIGSDTILEGDSRTTTSINLNDNCPSGTSILKNKTYNDNNITINKLCFNVRKAYQTGSYIYPALLRNVSNLTIDDCEFRDSDYIGLVVDSGLYDSNIHIEDSYALNNGRRAMYVQSLNDVAGGLSDISFLRCKTYYNAGGYDAYHCDDVTYTDCIAHHNGLAWGEYAKPGFSTDSGENIYYLRCSSYDNEWHGYATWINANGLRAANHITYDDCDSLRNGEAGFWCSNSHDVTWTNVCWSTGNQIGLWARSSFDTSNIVENLVAYDCRFDDSDQHGIFLEGVQSFLFESNYVRNNSRSESGIYDGIRIEDGVSAASGVYSRDVEIKNGYSFNTDTNACQSWGGEVSGKQ